MCDCGSDAIRVVRDCFFFFFQAEDGIRYYKVTGVQTCALPILATAVFLSASVGSSFDFPEPSPAPRPGPPPAPAPQPKPERSEERRVGKECRSRWSPDH